MKVDRRKLKLKMDYAEALPFYSRFKVLNDGGGDFQVGFLSALGALERREAGLSALDGFSVASGFGFGDGNTQDVGRRFM